MMQLSIIIVNYKTGPLTKVLIESLLSQMDIRNGSLYLNTSPLTPLLQKERGNKVEVIVVDNDSGDESVSFLRSDFPEISVIENGKNLGFAGGVNAGIEAAKGEYYLVLNPDMVAVDGSPQALVNYMEDNKDVGMGGGKLLSPNGDLQYSCFRFYRPMTIVYRRTWLGKTSAGQRDLARFEMHDYDRTNAQDVDWLQGSCMIIRARAVEEIGLMDKERFFMYFEDVDWCRRFWEAGWRVTYIPEAEFSHFHQRSSERGSIIASLTNWATREHIKSAIKYFIKYRGKRLPR